MIGPRTLPRSVERMLQHPLQLLANISAFVYSNLREPLNAATPYVARGAASHLRVGDNVGVEWEGWVPAFVEEPGFLLVLLFPASR